MLINKANNNVALFRTNLFQLKFILRKFFYTYYGQQVAYMTNDMIYKGGFHHLYILLGLIRTSNYSN